YLHKVIVTPDGSRAISSTANMVKYWDLKTGAELFSLSRAEGVGWGIALTTDAHRAIIGFVDGTIELWDLERKEKLQTLHGHTDEVLSSAVLPHGGGVVSASVDHTIRLWDLAAGRLLSSFTGESRMVDCAVSADGRMVAAGEVSGRIHFFSLVGYPEPA